MRLPLSGNIRVTSHFKSKLRPTHLGTDMVSDDRNVYAVESGRAVLREDSISGWGVNVYGPSGRKWETIHLQKNGRASGNVTEGQVIGQWGETVYADVTGAHLHFGLQINEGPQLDGYAYVVNNQPKPTGVSMVTSDVREAISKAFFGRSFSQVEKDNFHKLGQKTNDKVIEFSNSQEFINRQNLISGMQTTINDLTESNRQKQTLIDDLSKNPSKAELEELTRKLQAATEDDLAAADEIKALRKQVEDAKNNIQPVQPNPFKGFFNWIGKLIQGKK